MTIEKARKMLDTEWTMVLLRSGRLGIVMEDEKKGGLTIFGCDKSHSVLNLNGIVRVEKYDKNLCLEPDDPSDIDNINREYDIMAMYGYNYHGLTLLGLKRVLFGTKDQSTISWDWKREEVKEVTMADIEELFGCKVKIVKEEENGQS